MNIQSTRYPWISRIIFWLQARRYGRVLSSSLNWARSPKVFLALSFLYASLERKCSPIHPSLRTLILVRVSQLNGCSFCVDLNTSVLLQRGVSLEKAMALSSWKESALFDVQEKLVLEYTEAVTDSSVPMSDDLRARMHEHYAEQEIVEVTALIAFQNMSTKFNNAFGVEPQGFCALKC